MSRVKFISRDRLDVKKWDQCIDNATNGVIYAYSFYLDRMSKHWDALVYGDYEYVMPLTWNRKFGIHYLYQPPFTAALGAFGTDFPPTLIQQFYNAIPDDFKLIEIDLNPGNGVPHTSGQSLLRNNFVLDLSKSYQEIQQGYKDNVKRNIKKAVQLNCTYNNDISVDQVIELSRIQNEIRKEYTEHDYYRFRKLFMKLYQEKKAKACGVFGPNKDLVASCVYLFSHNRAYYILVGNHPNSKTMGASHFLIDRFIEEHSEQGLTLDFEGSDQRNVAFFYSSFGAHPETYPAIRVNNLPFWAKLLKRFRK